MAKAKKNKAGKLVLGDDGSATFRLKTRKRKSVEFGEVKIKFREGMIAFEDDGQGAMIETPIAEVTVTNPAGKVRLSLLMGQPQDVGFEGRKLTLKDLFFVYDKDLYVADFHMTSAT